MCVVIKRQIWNLKPFLNKTLPKKAISEAVQRKQKSIQQHINHPSPPRPPSIAYTAQIHPSASGLKTQNSIGPFYVPVLPLQLLHFSRTYTHTHTHKARANATIDSNTSPSIKMLFVRHKGVHREMMGCRGGVYDHTKHIHPI